MLSPGGFHDLVSGRRRGVAASCARGLLSVAEAPYTLVVRRRNLRFDTGRTEIERVPAPVVSVGNLTLGGTGKTPLVEWIARYVRSKGIRVALVSRGYGAGEAGRNDEALELEQKLPYVPHLQNPDRVAAARTAIEEFETQLILLDDGFQHRRLGRDLDIVLLDALEPFGLGRVFPRGLLREPVEGLRRADVVVLSRADMIDDDEREAIRRRAESLAPGALWRQAVHAPRRLVAANGQTTPIETLSETPVAAFCGIGNPAGFRGTLRQCGLQNLAAVREFPDHHDYRREDVESIVVWAAKHGAQAVVCTQKDLVKIGVNRLGDLPLWAIAIELQIVEGEQGLQQRLDEVMASCPG